ncbi:conserved hypothetical protein [Trichinella spiralis]|uniref:hypothetical protein n=1 Tax=Trichinella spiralis TaxID=6334 RepID=UPI0001EFB5F9|nr:conserved hypothetical protein [Trichinella spiralis]
MRACVQLARVSNFFEFFALLHANLFRSLVSQAASGRSRQLTSSRSTSSRQWSLVGPKIRPSGRENRVAQTSLQSVAYLLYTAAPMYAYCANPTVQPCLHLLYPTVIIT